MKLALELEADSGASYGTIHEASCRDLRDPEPIGNAATRAAAEAIAEGITGWGCEPGEYRFAPCAKLP